MLKLLDGFQPGHEPASPQGATLQQPIAVGDTKVPAHRYQVFQVHQFAQVSPQPGVTPMDGLAQFAPAERVLVGGGAGRFLVHEVLDECQQAPAGLGDVGKRTAKRCVRQFVGDGDVVQCGFDVGTIRDDPSPVRLPRASPWAASGTNTS